MTRPLPMRQLRILTYLESVRGRVRANQVAKDLGMKGTEAWVILRLLAAKDLVDAHPGSFVAEFMINDAGREALEAARKDAES
jgi:hypothetical protein